MRKGILLLLVATATAVAVVLARDPEAAAPAPPPDADPPATAWDSHYFRVLRKGEPVVPEMTPLLLSPLARETVAPSCPLLLSVVAGNGSYEPAVRPYLAAVEPADAAAHPFAATFARAWRDLWELTAAAPRTPPLRVLVKHYPRGELPGRCVTLQVTFYDVFDPYLDDPALRPTGGTAPGLIVDLLATYQLAGDRPRVVEAIAQVQSDLRRFPAQGTLLEHLGQDGLGRMLGWAGPFDAHFVAYGGGRRAGMLWVDRAAGMGEADPHGVSYTVSRPRADAPAQVDTGPLPAAAAAWLRTLVRRA